jgi:hypothetical protein
MSLSKVSIHSIINEAQYRRVEQIANEPYIKEVVVGFNTVNNCVLRITDDKDRVSSCSIDGNGEYINY